MRLPFGLSAYSRADGRLAPVRLLNVIGENAPTSPGGVAVLQRPGLAPYATRACRGLYREDGVFGGDLFEVSGTTLYRAGASIGTVAGSDRAEWAYTVDGLFVLSGGIIYQYNGTTLVATSFPASALVASIAQINSILVAVRADTGTIYFRLPGDTTWNALDFFSAERKPDPVKAVRVLGDTLYAFGSATVELFAATGNVATPFQRYGGAVVNRGIKDRDSIAALDNTLIFVGEDNIVYRLSEGAPIRVSDYGIEERIRLSATAKAFPYSWDGHSIYVLGLASETLALDAAGGWSQYTYDNGAFPSLGLYDGVTTYVGGAEVWTLADRSNDDGAAMERLFTAVLPTERPVACDCLEVQLSPGTTPVGTEPAIVQMRYSDNQGRTWSDWRNGSTGFGGEYRKRLRFRRLGMADAPGRLFEIRITDDVKVRFSGCELNPPGGGRSRD